MEENIYNENIDEMEIEETENEVGSGIPVGLIIGGAVAAIGAGAALVGRKIYNARHKTETAKVERKGFRPIEKLKRKKGYTEIEDFDAEIIDADDVEVSESK